MTDPKSNFIARYLRLEMALGVTAAVAAVAIGFALTRTGSSLLGELAVACFAAISLWMFSTFRGA